MSNRASTGPREVKSLIRPVVESPTTPPFDLTPAPETGLMIDDAGRGASAGKMVMNPSIPASGTVRLKLIPTAVAGIVQFPFVPQTNRSNASPAPSGDGRSPTVSGAGRVSNSRHGVIDTNDAGCASLPACTTQPAPPAPIATAMAAPMPAQRDRINDARCVLVLTGILRLLPSKSALLVISTHQY